MKKRDVVMCLQSPAAIEEKAFQMMAEHLPPRRYQKMQHFRRREDRILSTVSYCLLEYAFVCAGYELEDLVKIQYGAFGKPFCEGSGGPHFNISHCACAVACALSGQEIGIDVQEYDVTYESIMKYVCSERERSLIMLARYPKQQFVSLWTKKEAYLKMKGTGIGGNLQELDFAEEAGMSCFQKYGAFFRSAFMKEGAMTVCSNAAAPPKYQEVGMEEILDFILEQ